MLPIVSVETYKLVESESHSDSYLFIDEVTERIKSANPEIYKLIERWMKQYESKGWLAPSVAYACVVYRLLELSVDQLPIVMRETAKPLEREFWYADDPRRYFSDQLERILSENRYVALALAWSVFDALVKDDRTAISFIPILGVTVYRYLEKEAELDKAPKSKARVN